MSFESSIPSNAVVINDDTPDSALVPPEGMSKGLIERDRSIELPSGLMAPFDLPLIPREEWKERCEEMERTKTRLSDLIRAAGLKCKDQNGTNYCWINAPTYCVEVLRVVQGNPIVYLSPASVGSRIKGFRNVGGWGTEGLEYIAKNGVVPVELWPANAISKSYDKPEAWERAKDFVVSEWYDLQPRNLDQLFTCLFNRIPVACGYNHWSHETTALDPLWKSGKPATGNMNSWSESWGDKGYFVMEGNKMYPDDQIAPRVAVSGN